MLSRDQWFWRPDVCHTILEERWKLRNIELSYGTHWSFYDDFKNVHFALVKSTQYSKKKFSIKSDFSGTSVYQWAKQLFFLLKLFWVHFLLWSNFFYIFGIITKRRIFWYPNRHIWTKKNFLFLEGIMNTIWELKDHNKNARNRSLFGINGFL
jgi:hypothetical protein